MTLFYRDEASFRPDAPCWAWALGAIYSVHHGFPVDRLPDPASTERDYPEPVAALRIYLPRDWDITDRAGLVQAMRWLSQSGHRRPHRALVRRLCTLPAQPWAEHEAADREQAANGDAEARQRLWRMWAVDRDYRACRTASFLAFDAARAALLARCGYLLGHIDAPEMRAFLYDLAREVSATFSSWEAYGRDFVIARAFWAGAHEPDEWDGIVQTLLSDAKSPWTRLPFAFPEDGESRAVTSVDTRDGPYWTLEGVPVPAGALVA